MFGVTGSRSRLAETMGKMREQRMLLRSEMELLFIVKRLEREGEIEKRILL